MIILVLLGNAIADFVENWATRMVRYDVYVRPPLIQALREWVVTLGGNVAMAPVVET